MRALLLMTACLAATAMLPIPCPTHSLAVASAALTQPPELVPETPFPFLPVEPAEEPEIDLLRLLPPETEEPALAAPLRDALPAPEKVRAVPDWVREATVEVTVRVVLPGGEVRQHTMTVLRGSPARAKPTMPRVE